MGRSESDAPSSRSSARVAVRDDLHVAGRVAPLLGRERAGIMLSHAVGVPVHAVVASRDKPASAIVLEALSRAHGRAVLVTFANPSTALLARRTPAFCRDLLAFDFVLPDGIGMCMAIRSLHGLPARRVSFDMTSLAPLVFEHAQSEGLAIVLIGGAPGVAERARERIRAAYPGLRVTGALSGYGNIADSMRQIVALRPDILICGMGGVRQEAFLLDMRAQGWRGWGFTCGGFFDQLCGSLNYYPRWVDYANLRWAYRLLREPGRLWRRYLIQYSHFAWLVCAARIRQ